MVNKVLRFYMMLLIVALISSLAYVAASDWPSLRTVAVFPKELPLHKRDFDMGFGIIPTKDKFLYQAGIMIKTGETVEKRCSGALISEEWVLTAAHCLFKQKGSIEVFLGTHDPLEDERSTVTFEIKDVIIHEDYDPIKIKNDIALIQLPTKVTYNEFVQPVQLPNRLDKCADFGNFNALMSGWGKVSNNSKEDNQDMINVNYIDSTILSFDQCKILLNNITDETNVCAQPVDKKRGAWVGDTGGPLVTVDPKEERYLTLVGITLYSKACSFSDPTVFTCVSEYMDWIFNSMNNGPSPQLKID